MIAVNRRTFLGGSGSLVLAGQPAWGQDLRCPSSYVPPSLEVNCAARGNYKTFRDQSDRVHLAGAVSLLNFTGKYGPYHAGTLFLFPVLRAAHEQPRPKPGVRLPEITGLIPRSATASVALPPFAAGQDEETLLTLLEPKGNARMHFLGFRVDVPAKDGRSKLSRFTEGRLPDGKSIRIEWAVSNLNRPWFAGSASIPHDSTCGGAAWRKVIVEALKHATAEVCS